MNLLEECEQLDAKMELVDSAEINAELIRKLEMIQTSLVRHSSSAIALKGTLSSMLSEGVVDREQFKFAPENSKLQKSIATMQKRLAENRSKILEGNAWNNLDQVQAVGLAKFLSSELTKKWREYVKESIPGIETFQSFKVLPQCKETILELEKLSQDASDLKDQLPEDKESVRQVLTIQKEMSDLIDSLDLKDEPDEMLQFLKRCASMGGVPLEELTEEILAWLKKKGFDGNLKISTVRG